MEVFLPESSSLHWFSPQIQLHTPLSQNPANKGLVLADSRVSAAPYFFLSYIPFGIITTSNSKKVIKFAVHNSTSCGSDLCSSSDEKSRVGLWRQTREWHACESQSKFTFIDFLTLQFIKLKGKKTCLIYRTKLVNYTFYS